MALKRPADYDLEGFRSRPQQPGLPMNSYEATDCQTRVDALVRELEYQQRKLALMRELQMMDEAHLRRVSADSYNAAYRSDVPVGRYGQEPSQVSASNPSGPWTAPPKDNLAGYYGGLPSHMPAVGRPTVPSMRYPTSTSEVMQLVPPPKSKFDEGRENLPHSRENYGVKMPIAAKSDSSLSSSRSNSPAQRVAQKKPNQWDGQALSESDFLTLVQRTTQGPLPLAEPPRVNALAARAARAVENSRARVGVQVPFEQPPPPAYPPHDPHVVQHPNDRIAEDVDRFGRSWEGYRAPFAEARPWDSPPRRSVYPPSVAPRDGTIHFVPEMANMWNPP